MVKLWASQTNLVPWITMGTKKSWDQGLNGTKWLHRQEINDLFLTFPHVLSIFHRESTTIGATRALEFVKDIENLLFYVSFWTRLGFRLKASHYVRSCQAVSTLPKKCFRFKFYKILLTQRKFHWHGTSIIRVWNHQISSVMVFLVFAGQT